MRITKKTWTASADFSGNYTGDVIPVSRFGFGAIQVSWSGAPVGTLAIEVTANKDAASPVWTEVDTQSTSGISSHAFLLNVLHGEAYRVTYTSTSGTGTATVDTIFKAGDV